MEINFTFLEEKREYALFASACIDAEKILESSPVMSAVASRKALELCVKWIYSIDSALKPIEYRAGLQSLLHNNGFPSLMDYTLWKRLQYIVKNGNESVHILKFEETRKSLRDIMKFIPPKKVKIHFTDFEDEVVFREEGRKVDISSSDFEDYRAKVNEYVEAHKNQPAINKLLQNEPISTDDYKELERIFTKELGTAEDYQSNYQDTPFGLLIRKIAKMDRNAAYAAFSTFIAEERPNAEQICFIEQVVDYVVENGYINNVLDLMKAPFDRPYKFSVIFTREEQIKFVQVINSIKSNALIA